MQNFNNQIGKSSLNTMLSTIAENAPIYIILNYDNIRTLQFPVNPEEIKRTFSSSPLRQDIESIGEIAIPQKPKLSEITISSFFWSAIDLTPPMVYVNWIRTWQNSKKPAKLIITRFNFTMDVTCANFDYSIRAGEEGDVYFTLNLIEYRSYGAKKITMRNVALGSSKSSTFLSKLANIVNDVTSFVVLPILPVIRNTNNKLAFFTSGDKLKVKKDSSIASITKDLTGSTNDWRLLYNCNSDILGDDTDVSVGTELVIPDEWLKNDMIEIRG